MVKIDTIETQPITQENEITIEDVSNNSKSKSSEGDESSANPEDIEQMKGMTPEQKKFVQGLLGKIDRLENTLKRITDGANGLLDSLQGLNAKVEEANKELKLANS